MSNNHRLAKNVSWIMVGSMIHTLLEFLIGIFVARRLTLNDNGTLVYAASWITFFSALASLGFSNTISREFSRYDDRDGEFLCSGIIARIVMSVIAIVFLQFIIRVVCPGEKNLQMIVLIQSFAIFFGSFDLFVYWYRFHNKAGVAVIIQLTAFLIAAICRIVSIILNLDLIWYAISTIMETALIAVLLTICIFKKKNIKFAYSFSTVKELLKESYPFIFSAILCTVYSQIDRIMLKSMVDNSAVALYSVSAHLAIAISVIPHALVEGFRADIMEYRDRNISIYKRRIRQLYCVVFWLSTLYCLVVTLFPQQILWIIYGEKYVDASKSLALIVWFSVFSYFGAINNLYMVAEGKTRWVQITTLTGAIGNVLLNILLIPIWGIVGAAAASLITQFVANAILLVVIKDLRPCFALMVSGILFRDLRIVKDQIDR